MACLVAKLYVLVPDIPIVQYKVQAAAHWAAFAQAAHEGSDLWDLEDHVNRSRMNSVFDSKGSFTAISPPQ